MVNPARSVPSGLKASFSNAPRAGCAYRSGKIGAGWATVTAAAAGGACAGRLHADPASNPPAMKHAPKVFKSQVLEPPRYVAIIIHLGFGRPWQSQQRLKSSTRRNQLPSWFELEQVRSTNSFFCSERVPCVNCLAVRHRRDSGRAQTG